jgi:transcriptional regulator with XRE-family HTH domain
MTALELAEHIGRSEQHVYRLERGTARVRPEEAARIADALGYSLRVVFPDLATEEATT